MKNVIAWVTLVTMILGGSWGVFWLLEERHAQKTEVLTLKQDINRSKAQEDLDDAIDYIDYLSKLRVYYDDKEVSNTLDMADQRRADWVDEQLDRAYDEEARLRDRVDRLKE